uniref:Transmembrane protein 65 n=1 Tax=Trypanosoma congolense (strain IL3000) TaxID=1068625 RepID=G0UX08_TRYCI|nr:conserved hypothetical protein [Trypanosoma congolense IL3000]
MMRRLHCYALLGAPEKVCCWRRCLSGEGLPRMKQQELRRLTDILENDPKILRDVIGRLDAASRRRLIVTGGAIEWFGEDNALKEMKRAGVDKDRLLSADDLDHWLEEALRRRLEDGNEQPRKQVESGEGEVVPCSTLLWVAFVAGLPFVGFGFLDNAVMILAGDAIDNSVGFYLNCSVLACAAMGNIFSGVLGMQLHGVIEKAVQKLNFKAPPLTESQMRGKRVFFARHIGGTIGIMTGLLLGMTPLMLLDADDSENEHTPAVSWQVKLGLIE